MNVKPKKSLGQNFLKDKNVLDLIVNLGEITNQDTILEVGPGTGALTEKIIEKRPKKIIVIEKDKNLVKLLYEKFNNKIEIINQDILDTIESELSKEKITIFGNLPYNISTQILVKWIKIKNLEKVVAKFVLMFQKEVADRIVAKTNNKNYGRLSILSNWRLNIKKIKDINPNSFFPRPKVKSSILFIEPKKNYYKLNKINNLEYLTNVFFNQRRKMIKKPIKLLFKNKEIFENEIKINLNLRPQNLSPETYFKLCKYYEDLSSR